MSLYKQVFIINSNYNHCISYNWLNNWGFSTNRGFNTEIAMRKAKENVEKHYAVVGLLEDLNKTLTVLEHYVPRFFKGALDTYYSE